MVYIHKFQKVWCTESNFLHNRSAPCCFFTMHIYTSYAKTSLSREKVLNVKTWLYFHTVLVNQNGVLWVNNSTSCFSIVMGRKTMLIYSNKVLELHIEQRDDGLWFNADCINLFTVLNRTWEKCNSVILFLNIVKFSGVSCRALSGCLEKYE